MLAGLAVQDEEVARKIARKCIQLYDSEDKSDMAVYGRGHMLSKRFLDYSFPNGPLRPSLDEPLFLNSTSMNDWFEI